ncbi:MAG: electron transport complex subunit RsxE [Erysipelotrichales bacterium]|nr:electron transport complex subunit RsxE [Erysipelotrichales bacterium]
MKKPNFWQSLILENPLFIQYLGVCAVLGVTTSLDNALGMSVIVLIVLLCSNMLISALRKFIPNEIRIPVFIVVIATFVSVAEMLVKAFAPILYDNMGSFIALVVVNCIILGRAEACASKSTIAESAKDALVQGLGYAIAQFSMSIIRSFFGNGGWSLSNPFTGKQIFELTILPESLRLGFFTKAMGGFLTFGILAALFTGYKNRWDDARKEELKQERIKAALKMKAEREAAKAAKLAAEQKAKEEAEKAANTPAEVAA